MQIRGIRAGPNARLYHDLAVPPTGPVPCRLAALQPKKVIVGGSIEAVVAPIAGKYLSAQTEHELH
jgi:hypothetical protein